ncbi:IDEAL domain-containing protein [Paenibacillus ehimensis]|uniref:IDEAL domain-containing protein n=1 Tax=Paenibacillus ehimensis TaxID=79264 RepID=UPI002DB9FC73|nr:hypothetical protein [Paenibacillus ehimensis]MEC0209718.1 IDEAL domain-containing protein [Paenibacillus ehimensis]
MRLINEEVISIIKEYILNTYGEYKKFEIAVQVDEVDLLKINERSWDININNKNIQLIEFYIDNRKHQFTVKDIESILFEKHGGADVLLSVAVFLTDYLTDIKTDCDLRIIAEIEEKNSIKLPKDDLIEVINMAIAMNDKEWFHELSERYKECVY